MLWKLTYAVSGLLKSKGKSLKYFTECMIIVLGEVSVIIFKIMTVFQELL